MNGAVKVPHPRVLLDQRRHVGPMIIDMGHTMRFEHLLIFRSNQAGIANLNGIAKVFRELTKESIQA